LIRQTLGKLIYFMLYGAIWGILFGGLSGSLIVPIMGTILGGLWGLALGVVLGLVIGIVVTISDEIFGRAADRQTYRRRLAAVTGMLTIVGTVPLLILMSNNVLWGERRFDFGYPFVLLASVGAGVLWSGLAAAYTTAWHVDRDSAATSRERIDSLAVVDRMLRLLANRMTFVLGISAGVAYSIVQDFIFYRLSRATLPEALPQLPGIMAAGIAGGLFFTIAAILLLGLANGFLLLFVNRLYFKEYAPHLTLAQYKTRISVLVFLFTLVAGLIVSAVAFAPLSALIATLAARSYADWLYDGEDKFKRKAKENYDAARLEEFTADEDEITDALASGEALANKV
jgi:hypothetical protein